jgi:hypothetical protein
VLEIHPNNKNGGFMTASKISVLKPLIKSQGGIHLTAYLINKGNVIRLKQQLRETIEMAKEHILPVMSAEDVDKFIEPIIKLIDDNKLLKNIHGNIGIFRTFDTFRVLSLPVKVEQTCAVATSFHVKPLLRWMQSDREFLILGIGEASASLYQGNQNSLSLIDNLIFPKGTEVQEDFFNYIDLKKVRLEKQRQDDTLEWLNEQLYKLFKDAKPKLFVAGNKDVTTGFLKNCRYENTYKISVWPTFSSDKIALICAEVRSIQRKEIKKSFDFSMMEFHQVGDLNLANKNIFQIARAAIRGKISKLLIADGVNIFGKLDRKSGGLAIHPADLDHEDDDLLDDIAQEVLAHGGEVVVANRDQIPKGRPILAILKPTEDEIKQKIQSLYFGDLKLERKSL